MTCCADAEAVGFNLRALLTRKTESLLREEVLNIARSKITLKFTYILNCIVSTLVQIWSRNRRNDSWLGVCTFEEYSNAVNHAYSVEYIDHDPNS